MGLFGKILGGAKMPTGPPTGPPAPPPAAAPRPPPDRKPRKKLFGDPEQFGKPLEQSGAEAGPFPKRMRLRANLEAYNLVSAWQEVTLNGAQDLAAARAQVIGAYYKQFGLYRLPGGRETIRWNETTWREIQGDLQVLYDPGFTG
jgi:hypothetical protein